MRLPQLFHSKSDVDRFFPSPKEISQETTKGTSKTWEVHHEKGQKIHFAEHYQPQNLENLPQDIKDLLQSSIEIKLVDAGYRVILPPDYSPVKPSALTSGQRKFCREYLKYCIDNKLVVGQAWALFSSPKSKKVVVVGPNVHTADGFTANEGPMREFYEALEAYEDRLRKRRRLWLVPVILFLVMIAALLAWMYREQLRIYLPQPQVVQSDAMRFYAKVFPDVYAWLSGPDQTKKTIAQELLRPEYVEDLLRHTRRAFWTEDTASPDFSSRATRLILFDYFNYNREVEAKRKKYWNMIELTKFGDAYKRFSFCAECPSLTQSILYYKVGDLDLPQVANLDEYLKQHYIDSGFKKVSEADVYRLLPVEEQVKTKLKEILDREGRYAHIPLRIANPTAGNDWYLLTKPYSDTNRLDVAVFFRGSDSTPVPGDIAALLLAESESQGAPTGRSSFTWYKLTPEQARQFGLSNSPVSYFRSGSAQTVHTDIIQEKITRLKPQTVSDIKVEVRRDLLLTDGAQKYGLQADDPIVAMVLAKLILERSSENVGGPYLQRDVFPIHITSIQLSRAYEFSARVTDVQPGRTSVLDLFTQATSFKATLPDGSQAQFVKLDDNLFAPYGFKVVHNSITFVSRTEIEGMVVDIGSKRFRIAKDNDTYRLIEVQ